jgi:hypothetical protein
MYICIIMYGNSICERSLQNIKWCTLILILAIVWILLFIRRCQTGKFGKTPNSKVVGGADIYNSDMFRDIVGGAFDIRKFIEGLRKKYTDSHDHIEIELKLKDKSAYSKFAKWAKSQSDHTTENTINKIWTNGRENVIETIYDHETPSKWSTKQRLSKYEVELGPLAISLERDLDIAPSFITESSKPNMVRQKSRISANINKHWRLDCTKVRQTDAGMHNEGPKVRQSDAGEKDYWNVLDHINEIEEFIRSI